MITALMPSPIGHALAGVAVAFGADLVPHRASLNRGPVGAATAPHLSALTPRMTALLAGLAMLPDADLLFPGTHRMATHSLAAAAVVFIIAAVVTGKVTRTSVVCSVAYATHLLLDWLGADMVPPRGIELLWPFSHEWFISDLDVFRQTARRDFLTAPIIQQNAVAVGQEVAILLPIVAVLWWLRRRARPQ